VGIEPMRVPTTREAWRRGIGEGRLDHIALEGDPAEHLEVSDFRVPSNWEFALVPSFLGRLAARWFWVKPVVRTVTCTGCGDCVRACAASAIALGADGKAEVTRSRCVSCLCCIEVCPTGAVAPSKSALARLVK
jgi:ferredoxin